MNLLDVIAQAHAEVRGEKFREAVECEKARLRTHRPWWHRVFPFVITITRRPQ